MSLGGRLIRGPIRPDRWTALRFASMRWAALPVIDRRWTAPLSAIALGFGIFAGVAIGPGAEGSLGASAAQTVIEVVPANPQPVAVAPGPGDGGGPGPGGASEPAPAAPSSPTPPASDLTPPDSGPSSPITSAPSAPSAPLPDYSPPAQPPAQPQEPAPDPTTVISGTVVHLNSAAASYTVASDAGRLMAVHTKRNLPAVGVLVEVEVKSLDNGTYTESGDRTGDGRRGQVELNGTVSYSEPQTGGYTISAPGASIFVRAAAGKRVPELGDPVAVNARIADQPEPLEAAPPGREGCGRPPALPKRPRTALEQLELEITGEPAASTDLEAVVQGVCRDSRWLIVSADDLRESGRDIAVAVPDEIGIAGIFPGQVVSLDAKIRDSGNYEATAISGDEHTDDAR